jgi:DNA-binding CsgD family transcriptional regulator
MAHEFRLSPRESEVVRHVLDNLDVNDVAACCSISTRTVRAHLERVYGKLGLRNRSDLVLLVLAHVLAGPVSHVTTRARDGTKDSGAKDTGVKDSGAGASGVRASLKRVKRPS